MHIDIFNYKYFVDFSLTMHFNSSTNLLSPNQSHLWVRVSLVQVQLNTCRVSLKLKISYMKMFSVRKASSTLLFGASIRTWWGVSMCWWILRGRVKKTDGSCESATFFMWIYVLMSCPEVRFYWTDSDIVCLSLVGQLISVYTFLLEHVVWTLCWWSIMTMWMWEFLSVWQHINLYMLTRFLYKVEG